MTDEIEDLRSLAKQLEQIGRSSPAWSMVHTIIYNCTDQINAMATIKEMRRKLVTKEGGMT